jgi:hypothetical protein
VGGDFTTDYGQSWNGIHSPNSEKVFSHRYGIVGKGQAEVWYGVDTATRRQTALQQIPTSYRTLRATQSGTLIGFRDSLIAWMGPSDTAFREQRSFVLPFTSDSLFVAFTEEVTWRGELFFCLATTGKEWYLCSVGEDFIHIEHLQQSATNTHFKLFRVDEPGCMIAEYDINGQSLQYLLFDENGILVSRPEIHRMSMYVSDYKSTWSDSATYLVESEGQDPSPCHLYRISHLEPNKVEHIGKSFTGEAASAYQPMSICLLDTMNGALVGRDRRGAVLEYTTDGEMRGFLIRGSFTLPEQKTALLNYEHSVPTLITTDTMFALGTSDVNIGTGKGRLTGWIWNEKNPVTMLQRAADRTFYFGRRDIIHASYEGMPLDTIEVQLPGMNRDSIGVLSDIAEIDQQNLVVALRGHNMRTYDGELLSSVRGGLAYTMNRGATWQLGNVPSSDQAYYSVKKLSTGVLLAVSVDADILVDSATQNSTVRCYSGHLLRSTDNGKTWTSQSTFSPRNQSLSRCSYRIWQGTKRIYIATPEAVMISTDDGITWTAENDFPLNCIINGVAEHKGQLYVATTFGIYRENDPTSIAEQETRETSTIHATATLNGQAWRITVTGLPTSRITGIDVYDIQGRQHASEQLQSQEHTASITSPLPCQGIYGIVVHGEGGRKWTAAVGIYE